jgi:hypothetical protein
MTEHDTEMKSQVDFGSYPYMALFVNKFGFWASTPIAQKYVTKQAFLKVDGLRGSCGMLQDTSCYCLCLRNKLTQQRNAAVFLELSVNNLFRVLGM